MFASKKIAKSLKIKSPPDEWDIIRYMAGRRLDFHPGTRFAYSNFGYCLLGRVIEKVTGRSYGEWVRRNVLEPIGITEARLGRTLPGKRLPGEVRYYDGRGKTAAAVVGKVGKQVPRPYGLYYLEAMDAHGGWVMSAVDLARFSAAFADHQASPLLGAESLELMFTAPSFAERDAAGNVKGAFYGCGWRAKHKGKGRMNTWHSGNLEGTSTTMVRRHDGTSWVVLFNTDRNKQGKPLTKLIDSGLHKAAAAVEQWPAHDLFELFD
jgi:N-acyl-D-amino-acid deacylase